MQDQKALLEKFFKVLNWVQWFAFGLALLMIVVAVILIVNTIRVAAFSRRRETGHHEAGRRVELLDPAAVPARGRDLGFPRRLLASGVFVLLKAWLVDHVLAPNFPITRFITWGDVWLSSGVVFLIGVALAAIASFLTLLKYLRV